MDDIFLNSWVGNPIYAKAMTGVLIILLGFIIARTIGLLSYRLLQALELNRILKKTGFSLISEQWLSRQIEVMLYAASVIWAFYTWNIHMIAVYALLTITVVITITLLLSLKSQIPSFIAGFRVRKNIQEGQSINAGICKGRVSAIRFTYTIIKGRNGEHIAVPNILLSKSLKH